MNGATVIVWKRTLPGWAIQILWTDIRCDYNHISIIIVIPIRTYVPALTLRNISSFESIYMAKLEWERERAQFACKHTLSVSYFFLHALLRNATKCNHDQSEAEYTVLFFSRIVPVSDETIEMLASFKNTSLCYTLTPGLPLQETPLGPVQVGSSLPDQVRQLVQVRCLRHSTPH